MFLAKSLVIFIFLACLLFSISNPVYSLSAVIPKSDSVIRAQIQTQITANAMLSKLQLDLKVSKGVVSINGVVPLKRDAHALIILAESIAGVQSVDASGLSLPEGKTLTADDIINSLVIGTFNREGLMGPLSKRPAVISVAGPGNVTYVIPPPPIDLHVKTKDGVVYLSGKVSNQKLADQAMDLAEDIPGVTAVQSSVAVVSPQ